MKKTSAVWIGIFLILFNYIAQPQQAKAQEASMIAPYRLSITFAKTTNLIFPYAIKSVDKGSKDVLVQKASGVENVLQLKAAKQGFEETNLTVVTADGSLFSYVLNYALAPTGINIKAENPQIKSGPVAVFAEDATTDKVRLNAEKVLTKKRSMNGPNNHNTGVSVGVKGLYIQDDIFYLQLYLENHSNIDYDISLLRCAIRDKKKAKRTASQELEIEPVFVLGNINKIRRKSEQTAVLAIPKFTIPDKKRFELRILENNGGRHLGLQLSNKAIMQALLVN